MISKNVQIDSQLFIDLWRYFHGEDSPELAERLGRQLDEKLDKLQARELFTKYKRTPTGAEREQARQEYLNHQDVMNDWRTDTEVRKEQM